MLQYELTFRGRFGQFEVGRPLCVWFGLCNSNVGVAVMCFASYGSEIHKSYHSECYSMHGKRCLSMSVSCWIVRVMYFSVLRGTCASRRKFQGVELIVHRRGRVHVRIHNFEPKIPARIRGQPCCNIGTGAPLASERTAAFSPFPHDLEKSHDFHKLFCFSLASLVSG